MPAVYLLCAFWLMGVPIIAAGTSAPEGAAARVVRPAARAAALPACTIIGTPAADTLDGTRGDDVICALSGDDTVRGRGGDDVLFGSRGDDLVDGGPGDDRLYGYQGVDRLRGRGGRDFVQGGAGPDVLSGGPGLDVADYGLRSAPVRVSLGRGANDGAPGEGDDVRGDVERVRGGGAGDTLTGNARGNQLYGRGGDDELDGGRGDDRLWGGPGRDRLDGRDRARFDDALHCGAGAPDAALADAGDRVADDCEEVTQPGQRNHPPTQIRLSNRTVGENQPAGTVVGMLMAADRDAGDRHRFTLVAGTGAADNGAFTIAGDQLRTAAVFDFEGKARYSVRVRVGDGHGGSYEAAFAITVTDVSEAVNRPPSGISLSHASVAENEPVGTDVGTLSASDPDAGDTHSFALVPGAGSEDNGSFQIEGATLKTAAFFDFETKPTYSVRIRATDHGTPAGQIVRAFTITITDTTEPPIADARSVATDEDTGVTITLSATDPEGDDVTSFTPSGASHGTVGAVGPITCTGTPMLCTADVDFSPEANYNGPAGFSYTASDGAHDSLPATVSVTVRPVNDIPVAQSGGRTTDEDTPLALDLGSLVSDVETADADLTYTILAQPAHGSATASTYTPDSDYNGPDSLTYRVTDRGDPDGCSGAPCAGPETSTTETVSITVNPVNDTPQADSTSMSVDEDGSLPIDLAALASDLETADANLIYTIDTAPAHGSLTGSGASLTYTPDPDYNGPDGFTYRVSDRGDPDGCSGAPCAAAKSATGTVSIAVNAINDAPVNLLPAGPVAAVQAADTPLTGLMVTDVDAGGDDVELTLAVENGTLTVDTAVFGGVGVLQVTGNGTATVVITASLAQINTTLADPGGLVYRSAADYTGPDTLTVTSDDLGHTGAGGARTDTDTLGIVVSPPNAAPVAAAQTVGVDEDSAETITLSATDADGDDPLTFAIGTAPAHGSLGPLGAVTCSHATPNVCTADVVYTPTAGYNGLDSFSFTANDGQVDSAPATVSITVNPVNDAPRLENIEVAALSYTENDPATQITATTTVSDVDSADFDSGTLTVDFAAGGTAEDRLEIANQGIGAGQIGVSFSSVTFAGVAIGTFAGGTGTVPLVVMLNANATTAAVQALVGAITYRNVSDSPATAARTVRFVLTDGDGGTSAPATRAIALTAVNDAPVLAAIEPGALAYTENDPATAVNSTLTVTDPDSNITGATITIATNLAASEDVLSFANTPQITGGYNPATGVLTLSGSASPADYQTALRAVKYQNTSDTPSTGTRTISFQVKDGPDPANLSNTVARDVTVTAVNDAPVADDETFNAANGAVGNTTLAVNAPGDGAPATADPTDTAPVTDRPHKTITGDILAGDTDIDGPGPLTVTPGTITTNDGGTVTLQADGDFTFEPAASMSCTDTSDFFDYTVSDQNATGPGPTPGTDSGRVTITISGCAWYVNNDDAQGNSGTAEKPFDTLAQAETASSAGHTIFVYDGNNTTTGYSTGFNLKANQRLIGEAATLTVGSDTLHGADAANKPTITDSNADVIDLDDNNEVRGLNIDPSGAGGGIAGSSGDTGGATIDDVNIVDAAPFGTQPGLELDATAGTFNISNLTVSTTGATGVRLNSAGIVNFAPAGTISITTAGAKALDVAATNMGTSTFDAITVTGSGNGGVSLAGTAGTMTFGDLALTTTSGATAAFLLSNAGTVTLPASGTANLSATGGPGVDVTGTSGATLTFDGVSSTNSANDGINLAGLGTGTFSATSGTVTGAAGIAFDLDGGSGDVTYPGAFGDGTGATAEITNRTGGSVSLSGAISDSNDAGGGVSLSGNTGGSTSISNVSKTLNTTTSDAVSFTGSDGHTLNLTGGGLDVDTTTGRGIFANNSGTLVVSGTGNTIDSTSAAALSVTNTDIGTSGATFQSIASGNNTAAPDPASGIVLNDTGSTAGLTVTGTASADSGGTIQHTTSHGVALTSTHAVSLNRMNVQSTAGAGVRGTTAVDDFAFTNGTINNSGTGGGNQESSIAFNDPTGSATDAKVTGAVTITGNTLTNALWHGVSILQFAGTIDDVNISNNTLTSGTTTGSGGNSFGSGIQLYTGGVASTAASVTRAELNNNTITNFPGGVPLALQGGTSNGSGPVGSYGTPGSATNDIEVQGNILNGGGTTPDGAGGFVKPNQLILATVNGRGVGNFNIQNNGTAADPISGSIGNAIDISAGGAVTVQAIASGNRIDVAGQAVSGTSGIAAGVGPFAVTGGATLSTATLYATVQNNNIANSAGSGIRLNTNAGDPTLNAIVTGNTVGAPISATYGIQVVQGNNAGFTGNTNLQISNNTATGGTGGGNTFPGIGLRKFGTALNEFSIVGLSPSPATNAQMEASVAGMNTSTPGTFGTNGVAAVNGSSNNWTAIASVPQPPAVP